jgi:PAS domain S-box-containing protein
LTAPAPGVLWKSVRTPEMDTTRMDRLAALEAENARLREELAWAEANGAWSGPPGAGVDSSARVRLAPRISWTADPEGRITGLPERWLELTGAEREAALGDGWLRLVHPEDRAAVSTTWARALTSTGPFDTEYRLRRSGGDYRWVHARALPQRGPQGNILRWHGVTEDVHERRAAEDSLRVLNETLETRVAERTHELAAANARLQSEIAERGRAEEALRHAQKMEAVGQLTGGIAHDFNNLLSGILGSLSLLQKRLELGQVDQAGRYIDAAMSSVNRAAALTHRLLAFSRRQPLEPRPVEAHQLIVSLEELLRRTIGPSIQLEVRPAEGLWHTLCDPHQLENALLNLVINARDAMPSGGRLALETENARLELGYRTLEATDGPEGLKVVQSKKRIDLLVTDIGLPGLNGRQLADAARELRPGLKVLFMTGYAENAVFGTGYLDAGMQMITKPFDPEALATRVRGMFES